MIAISYLSNRLSWLTTSLHFFKRHLLTVVICGLVAGVGRVAQLGGFGETTPLTNGVLEVLVEGSRLFLLLFVLGGGNSIAGWRRVRLFFVNSEKRKAFILKAKTGIRSNGWPILFSFIGFSIIAVVLNLLIQTLAYETCLFITLKMRGILSDSSSEWTILLFFKNLSVIPFTLIFQTLLLLWITGRVNGAVGKNVLKTTDQYHQQS
jgi:hypothetical protein